MPRFPITCKKVLQALNNGRTVAKYFSLIRVKKGKHLNRGKFLFRKICWPHLQKWLKPKIRHLNKINPVRKRFMQPTTGLTKVIWRGNLSEAVRNRAD